MATPLGPYLPTNELVAVAWLSQRVPAFVGKSMVATKLPRAAADGTVSWLDEGFVQAQALPGGIPDVEVYSRRPVIQVDGWAAPGPGSVKPPWGLANRLVELVIAATEDTQTFGRTVTLPEGYVGARVLAVYPISEPRRVLDDPSGYARFTLDLAVDWVRVP